LTTRQSFTAIVCASPGDAARLANLLAAAPWAGGKPDLIEANGAEVDVSWRTAPAVPLAVPMAAIASAKAGTTIGPVSFTHSTTASGGTTTTSSRQ
jgi:hypothetical protein